jgi:DNA-binding transcriptional LysR family regulator
MTLYQLKILDAVARHLNITQASSELHASQPAVSQQLKLLQEEYGSRFISRQSHGIELTAEGRAFLAAIRPVLAQLEIIEERFRADHGRKKNTNLRVGGSSSISVSLIPALLMDFRKNHPDIGFVLETNDSRTLEQRVLESELDLAIIINPSNSPLLVCEPYARHKVAAFAAPSCPMVGRVVSLAELAAKGLVLRTGSIVMDELVRLGLSSNLVSQCEAPEAVKAAVYNGLGVGILHRDSVEHDLRTGALKMLEVRELARIEVRSYIVYDNRKPLSLVAQHFLALLREKKTAIVRQYPPEPSAPRKSVRSSEPVPDLKRGDRQLH